MESYVLVHVCFHLPELFDKKTNQIDYNVGTP